MSVCELCELYIEGSDVMEIYDTQKHETVFRGTYDEAQVCDYYDHEISSFEIQDGILVINIYK